MAMNGERKLRRDAERRSEGSQDPRQRSTFREELEHIRARARADPKRPTDGRHHGIEGRRHLIGLREGFRTSLHLCDQLFESNCEVVAVGLLDELAEVTARTKSQGPGRRLDEHEWEQT